MAERQYRTFAEFWPFYVREHADPRNRLMHGIGTSLGLALFGVILATGNWRLAVLLPVIGYGFSWYGHFFLQKNRPATFTYPLWSLAADFKMYGLMVTGRMGAVVAEVMAGEPDQRRR